jgi:hypothetical protein
MSKLIGRRSFLAGSALLGGLAATAFIRRAAAAPPAIIADGTAIGTGKMLVVEDGPGGRILCFDSAARSYPISEIRPTDVVMVSSYAGTPVMSPLFGQGAKAIIAYDAGIGKDEAGISALKIGEELGVPLAAVRAMSAEAANGRSLALGEISRVNAPARALGVAPGQIAYEAALRLAAATIGKPVKVPASTDEKPQVVEETPKGKIWASTSSFVFKEKMPNDVVCIGANSGRVFAESLMDFLPRGAISNDTGIGKNNSGVAGVMMVAEHGIAAASVAALSARIGSGMSTWNDGIISVVNRIAAERGVKVGMTAKEAARLML